jgi:L-threonylcarbamoyladenylate synthase
MAGAVPIPYGSEIVDFGLRIRHGELVSASCLPPSPANIVRAATALRDGGVAILPTDTVYGLCADIRCPDAVSRIYEAKGKAFEAPLQLLFCDTRRLDEFADLSTAATLLIDALGPGGWTIVSRARPGWQSPALAGGTTVGFRVPSSTVLQAVVKSLGGPLAASSANRHGGTSPGVCEDAVGQIGDFCDIALNGGPTAAGIDSTVIDCSDEAVRILREGAIDRHTLARILGVRDIPVLRSVRT